MTPAERVRAQAREATRMVLLEAGLAETVDRGGEIPSIEKLCARAGYTRGAFYVHFRDREHFVGELLDWVLDDILRSLFESATSGTADVREIITRFTDSLATGDWPDLQSDIRAGYLAVLRELRPGSLVRERHAELMTGIVARLAERIRMGQERHEIRTDVDAEDLGRLLLLIAIGAIVWNGVGIVDDARLGESLIGLISSD